jgi:signal peptidase II
MQKPGHPVKWGKTIFSLSALLILGADQLSKLWIRTNLAFGESLPERGLFRLTHVQNTGASFGLFPDQSLLITIIVMAGIVVLLPFAFFIVPRFPFLNNKLGMAALGLVTAGAAGNLVDRLRLGHVTDFIDIGIWPSFNIADSSVVIGTIIIAYLMLTKTGAGKNQQQQEQA